MPVDFDRCADWRYKIFEPLINHFMRYSARAKHKISITIDYKLFRELENLREREKRSTFIEHLIILGLKTYINKKEELKVKPRKAPVVVLSPMNFSETKH